MGHKKGKGVVKRYQRQKVPTSLFCDRGGAASQLAGDQDTPRFLAVHGPSTIGLTQGGIALPSRNEWAQQASRRHDSR